MIILYRQVLLEQSFEALRVYANSHHLSSRQEIILAEQENLFCFPLVGYRLHCLPDTAGISQIIFSDWPELIIKLIHKGYTGRDIHADNFLFGQIVEILHKCTQTISVC